MATGRVLQFDQGRGYGFVAADDGGEDVFLHASVFDGDPDDLIPGARVSFKVMAGDRGRKAFAAHIVADESDPADGPAPQPWPVPPPGSQAVLSDAPRTPVEADEDQLCDVLSPAEFSVELTELLLTVAPDLTGQQILQIRQGMLDFAKKHGWSDG